MRDLRSSNIVLEISEQDLSSMFALDYPVLTDGALE
jgi:hypothetical protein